MSDAQHEVEQPEQRGQRWQRWQPDDTVLLALRGLFDEPDQPDESDPRFSLKSAIQGHSRRIAARRIGVEFPPGEYETPSSDTEVDEAYAHHSREYLSRKDKRSAAPQGDDADKAGSEEGDDEYDADYYDSEDENGIFDNWYNDEGIVCVGAEARETAMDTLDEQRRERDRDRETQDDVSSFSLSPCLQRCTFRN
ncbi:hypothetical protein KEM55_006134 [Ascosphaera atra]|nr:hypothetical protein KEM55_006134 [Ascosphaera atra]